ncbi:MAG TPA: SAM-dependent methyltransferase [Nocardioidaceae bacterium]|nr:SAM-dependent methyltransferase [Nocardioidaceae bacterium]
MTATDYFHRLYAASDDPWSLASRPYERRKYAVTLACLPRPRYRSAFEPGCSIGVLTGRLARRCARLLAMDAVPRAVEEARAATGRMPHVQVRTGTVPADWPEGRHDLVVLSELLYYLCSEDRRRVAELTLSSLEPGGHLLAVHWRHPFGEAPTDGDRVHAELAATPGLSLLVNHTERDFLAQVFVRE